MELVVATGNRKKLKEIQTIFLDDLIKAANIFMTKFPLCINPYAAHHQMQRYIGSAECLMGAAIRVILRVA